MLFIQNGTSVFSLVTEAVVLMAILSLDNAYDWHHDEDSFQAPIDSALYTQELDFGQHHNYYTPEHPDCLSANSYKKLTFENIYDGIELVYNGKKGSMKYNFIHKAVGDAGKLIIRYQGASSNCIKKNGNVIITTHLREIRK